MAERLFIHVGAPKSGSTFLQGVMWRNREELRRSGVGVLGDSQEDVYAAGRSVRGVRPSSGDPGADWAEAWDRLAASARTAGEPTVVVSDEHLAAASESQVGRALASLEPLTVHVVYTVRDLASVLPSEWQEYVKHGEHRDFAVWAVDTLGARSARPQPWFWQVHDVPQVLTRWSRDGGPHTHVVVVPESGAPAEELWRRFAHVIGAEDVICDMEVSGNRSLGPVETQLLRQLNERLGSSLSRWQHFAVVRDLLGSEILAGRSAAVPPPIPASVRPILMGMSNDIADRTLAVRPDVVGDLESIRVTQLPDRSDSPAITNSDVAEAAMDALVGLVTAAGGALVREGRLRRELADTRGELEEARNSLAASRNSLAEVHASRSWRVTAPLRVPSGWWRTKSVDMPDKEREH